MKSLAAVVFSPFLLAGVFAGSLTDIAYAQQPGPLALVIPPPQYREIARGVRVIRMWELEGGPRDPEIAVIEVRGEAHHEFHEDPFAFMNKY